MDYVAMWPSSASFCGSAWDDCADAMAYGIVRKVTTLELFHLRSAFVSVDQPPQAFFAPYQRKMCHILTVHQQKIESVKHWLTTAAKQLVELAPSLVQVELPAPGADNSRCGANKAFVDVILAGDQISSTITDWARARKLHLQFEYPIRMIEWSGDTVCDA